MYCFTSSTTTLSVAVCPSFVAVTTHVPYPVRSKVTVPVLVAVKVLEPHLQVTELPLGIVAII